MAYNPFSGFPHNHGRHQEYMPIDIPHLHSRQPTSPNDGGGHSPDYGGDLSNVDQLMNDSMLLTPHASAPTMESSPYFSYPPVNPQQLPQPRGDYDYNLFYAHNNPTIPIGPPYQSNYPNMGSNQPTALSMPMGMGHLQPFGHISQAPQGPPAFGYGNHPSPFNITSHPAFPPIAPLVALPQHPPIPNITPHHTDPENSPPPSQSKVKPKRSKSKREPPTVTPTGTVTSRDFSGDPPTAAETDEYLRRWFKNSKNISFPLNAPVSLDGLPDGPVGKKPAFTLQELIALAIWGSPMKRLTLREILWALKKRFRFFNEASTYSEQAWERSIRHRLSLKAMFILENREMDEPGKGGWWSLDIRGGNNETRPKTNRKKTKKQFDEDSDMDDDDVMSDKHAHRRSATPNSPYSKPSDELAPNRRRRGSVRSVNASSRNSPMSVPSPAAADPTVNFDWAATAQQLGHDDPSLSYYLPDSPPSDVGSLPTPELLPFPFQSPEPSTNRNRNIRGPVRGHATQPVVGYTHAQPGPSRAVRGSQGGNTQHPSFLGQVNEITAGGTPQSGVKYEGEDDDMYA